MYKNILIPTDGVRTCESAISHGVELAKAIGASSLQVLAIYLSEAALLSLAGGALGLATGLGIASVLRWAIPGLPVHTPVQYVFIALGVSLLVGLVSGVLPVARPSTVSFFRRIL